MNSVIINFLFDECVTGHLKKYAVGKGYHGSDRVVYIGLAGKSDEEITKRAIRDDWTVVTADDDYLDSYLEQPFHTGLIYFKCSTDDNWRSHINYFQKVLDEMQNQNITDLTNILIKVIEGTVEIIDPYPPV